MSFRRIVNGSELSGSLVTTKSAILSSVYEGNMPSSGPSVSPPIPQLQITHKLSRPSNLLIISLYIGAMGIEQGEGAAPNIGVALHDGTDFIAIGDSANNRVPISSGGLFQNDRAALTIVHAPGPDEKNYNVRLVSVFDGETPGAFYTVNRVLSESNSTQNVARAVSSLTIQEIYA